MAQSGARRLDSARRLFYHRTQRGEVSIEKLFLFCWVLGTSVGASAPGSAEQERDDQEILSYKQVLDSDPKDIGCRYKLAEALYDRGKLAEALVQYQAILADRPDDAAALYDIGLIHYHQKNYTAAIEYFGRASDLIGEDDNLYYHLGICQVALRNHPSAIAMLEKAVALNPAHASALMNLGNSRFHSGQLTQAAEVYRRIVALNGEEREAAQARRNLGTTLYNLALGYANKGDCRTAVQFARESYDYIEDKKKAYRLAASCEYSRGQYALAVPEYLKVLQLDGRDVEARVYLGYCHLTLTNLAQALETFEAALQLSPGNREALKGKAQVLGRLFKERHEAAVRAFNSEAYLEAWESIREALKLVPDHPKAVSDREVIEKQLRSMIPRLTEEGDRLVAAQDYAAAYRQYVTILELDSTLVDVQQKRDRISAELDAQMEGPYQEALRAVAADRCHEAAPILRSILGKKRDFKDAAKQLTACRTKLGEVTDKQYREALLLYENGDYKAALDSLKAILTVDPEFVDYTGVAKLARQRIEERAQRIRQLTEAGLQAYAKGEYLEAQGEFKKLVGVDPDNDVGQKYVRECEARIKAQIGEALASGRQDFEKRRYREAASSFERALQLAPSSLEAQTYTRRSRSMVLVEEAEAYASKKEFILALDSFGAALELHKDNESARRGSERTLKARDSEIRTTLAYGTQCLADRRIPEAERAFQTILQQYQADHAEAAARLKQAQSAAPTGVVTPARGSSPAATATQARTEGSQTGVVSSQTRTQAASGKTGPGEGAEARPVCTEQSGTPLTARETLNGLYAIGIAYFESGEYSRSIDQWRRVLSLCPGHEKARRNIESARRRLMLRG